MDKITLDKEVFKALASDTRLEILKALDVRQKTVTELAKELNLNKSTLLEHLDKLAVVDLVQKLEDERKWVYWQLTWTGRRLLHPERITLAILLSTAGGAIVAAFAAIWTWLGSGIAGGGGGGEFEASPFGAAETTMMEKSAPPPEAALDPVWLFVAIGFGALAVLLAAWAIRVHLKAQAKAAEAAA